MQSISSNKTGMRSISCKSVPSPIEKKTKKKYVYQRPKRDKGGISSLLRQTRAKMKMIKSSQ